MWSYAARFKCCHKIGTDRKWQIAKFPLILATEGRSIHVLLKWIPQLIFNDFELFVLVHVMFQIFLPKHVSKPCNINTHTQILEDQHRMQFKPVTSSRRYKIHTLTQNQNDMLYISTFYLLPDDEHTEQHTERFDQNRKILKWDIKTVSERLSELY